MEIFYNKGKEKSRLGFVGDAAVAGGFAATVIGSSWAGIIFGLIVKAVLVPVFIVVGLWWKKKGLWDYELEYISQINPVLRRIERNVRRGKP